MDLKQLVCMLLSLSKAYVSVTWLSNFFALTPRSARKVLSELERMGVVKRWNNDVYKLDLREAIRLLQLE